MVNIEQISNKLKNLFNGTDIENAGEISLVNDNYFFNVATAGIELKEIYDMKSGKNFIPVFVSAIGGTFNPIPNLKEYEGNYQVEVFFPVRFKEDFYGSFTSFLLENLVARILTFENGEKALCNVGVPQYGEIETAVVSQFQNFITNTYKQPFQVSEQWMSMTFTLFAKGSSNTNYMLANEVEYELSYKGVVIENAIIQSGSIGYQASPQSEQIIGTKEAKSIASTSATAYTLTIIVERNNTSLRGLVEDLLQGTLQNNDLRLGIKIYDDFIYLDTFATSVGMPIVLGSALQITITFNRKVEIYGN